MSSSVLDRPDKTRAVSVLNGFKNESFYEFIGEVIFEN